MNCVAFAHRKKLNQRLVLPDRVKEILRRPQDEVNASKLQELAGAIKSEIEGIACVYFATSSEIEALAVAVEGCHTATAEEVGPYVPSVTGERQKVPTGACLLIEVDKTLPLAEQRHRAAELVRSFDEGQAVHVKMRPWNTWRRAPVDTFARDLMDNKVDLSGDNTEELRDRLLLAPGLGHGSFGLQMPQFRIGCVVLNAVCERA